MAEHIPPLARLIARRAAASQELSALKAGAAGFLVLDDVKHRTAIAAARAEVAAGGSQTALTEALAAQAADETTYAAQALDRAANAAAQQSTQDEIDALDIAIEGEQRARLERQRAAALAKFDALNARYQDALDTLTGLWPKLMAAAQRAQLGTAEEYRTVRPASVLHRFSTHEGLVWSEPAPLPEGFDAATIAEIEAVL